MRSPYPILSGVEHLTGLGANDLSAATMLDFWRWAFGDLCPNSIRRVFSEWLVAQLLGIRLEGCRDPWAACDLITPEEVRIEVKSCAYLQAWHAGAKPSRIEWAGLTGQTWDAATNLYSGERTYNADLYVLCVQTERDAERWNALDLSQWRFYLVTRKQLVDWNVRSLRESRLQRETEALTAAEFQVRGREAIIRAAQAGVHE